MGSWRKVRAARLAGHVRRLSPNGAKSQVAAPPHRKDLSTERRRPAKIARSTKDMSDLPMTLTNDQRAAITTAGNVRMTVDGIECVLVRSDLFDRLRSVLGDDWRHDEMR